jgi:L-histidine N-alpha-methyltransferase
VTAALEPTFEVHLDPDWARRALLADVRAGLGDLPRSLPPRWLYDDRGSQLFDEITRLPEYYPTEREREILRGRAAEIVARSGADTLIELGSGTSDKTRILLDAFWAADSLHHLVVLDVSENTLRAAAGELAGRYPGLAVHGIVGDFHLHLDRLPERGRRMVVFLGGTVGNFEPGQRREFLDGVAAALRPGDTLLLGTDLVKSADRLIAAYYDSQGVTERFVRNVLHVVNREAAADFDVDAFEYVPLWDPSRERMDLRLRARGEQKVHIPDADLDLRLRDGEEIRVEVSTKFRPAGVVAELAAAGFTVAEQWCDADGDFALTLAVRD